jgi:hypothetical protein
MAGMGSVTDETIIDGWEVMTGRPGDAGRTVQPSVLAPTSQCEVLHTVSVMGFMFPFLANRLLWT